MTSRHTIVIIGAGVAGLSAAKFLADRGFDPRVFEASDKVGGCCATTTIDGYTFNDGAIYLALIGLIDHAFRRLGLDRARSLPLRKASIGFSTTLPDGTIVALGDDRELRVTGRAVDAKRLRDEMHALIARWRPFMRFVQEDLVVHPFSPWRLLRKGWRHLPRFRGTVAGELDRCFSDPAVRSALAGTMLYTGLPADRTPATAMAGLVASLEEGCFVPEGGMGRLPEVLSAALRERGVPIRLGSRVARIVLEQGHVRGVEVDGIGRIDADAVLSTASGMLTFGSLLDRTQLPRAIAQRLERAPLSHRAASIQLGFAGPFAAAADSVSVLPWMEEQQQILAQDGREMRFPVYVITSRSNPELAPPGGSTVEMFYPVKAGTPLEHWTEERKTRLLEMALGALHEAGGRDVAAARVRSPHDFATSMNLYEGALYGLSPAATPMDLFPHASGIPGLFLAGQTTYPGYGVGPSMMSGIFAAERLARDW